MLNRNIIVDRERNLTKGFFNTGPVEMPELPDWVSNEIIQYWDRNDFHIHYIPKISLGKDLNLPLWHDRPSKVFYRRIKEGRLKADANVLPGKWILIDGRDKPAKRVPWIRVNDVWLLEKMGFSPKNYLKKWKKQLHQNEYLADALNERGFGSRFCLSIYEINSLKPHILNFLKIDSQKKIRLPFFAEYNYLGNAAYKQWRSTETWEWLEDKCDSLLYSAGGSKSVGCVGWEPPEFWSTILTFRPVIEL